MMGRKGAFTTLTGALALVLTTQAAEAQICSGYPTAPGQTSVGLRASFPTGATVIGVEASRNWLNPLGAFATFNLRMPDDDDADSAPLFGVGFAYEVTDFLPAVPQWLSACPLASVTLGRTGNTT
jgi:hypothetical protein